MYQLMASLAEGYAAGLMGLTAFVQPFHYMCAKRRYLRVPRAGVRFCVDICRVVALSLFVDPKAFNRNIVEATGHTLEGRTYVKDQIVVITDASPEGICAAIVCPTTGDFICYTYMPVLFQDPEGSFQGLREYLGLLVAFVLIR